MSALSRRIRPYFHWTVNLAAVFLCTAGWVHAETPAPSSDPAPAASGEPAMPDLLKESGADNADAQKGGASEEVPDIIAKVFPAKVIRRSNSNRTYLLEHIGPEGATVGRIVLLKREAENIMAFRVLKTYADKKQFAAKRVRRYKNYRILDIGESFQAIEKKSDVAPPPQTAQDKSDILELEDAETKATGAPSPATPPQAAPQAPLPDTQGYDPELDAGSSPPPDGAADSDNDSSTPVDDDDDDALRLTVEEVFPVDVHFHGISAVFGFFKYNTIAGAQAFASGAGIRYAWTPLRLLFLRKSTVQDSLAAEGGIHAYKLLGFATAQDAYSVLHMSVVGRYNMLFGETLGIFFFGGMARGSVFDSAQETEEGVTALSAFQLSMGGGLLIRVGPSWDLRFDLGTDMIGAGLMLRF